MSGSNQHSLQMLLDKIEGLESDMAVHFARVNEAASLLSKWRQWAIIHGHANHAEGLILQTNDLIGIDT